MRSGEQLIQANGVELCIETFGDPIDPAILLIHGACASMLWWEDELCALIASHERFVIRYDNRDTGRSTSYPPGKPGYSLNDMVNDALGILDYLAIERAHVVGRSMSGAIAIALAVDHVHRVASVTLAFTTPGDEDLPPESEEFLAAASTGPDFSDQDDVTESIVTVLRAYSGGSPYFDEPATRRIAALDVARSHDIEAALTNHFCIDIDAPVSGGLEDIAVPVLIVHGDADPVFPLPHAQAMHRSIPGSTLLVLPGAGHELPREYWNLFATHVVQQSNAQ